MRILILVMAALSLAACNQPAPTGSQDGAQSASAAASGPRFYGREAFTIVYEQTGTQTGAWTEHVRNWGNLRAEIKNLTLSMMGVTQNENSRVVYDGDKIVTIDLTTGATTIATNPLYDQVVQAIGGGDGVEFGQTIMTQMGGQPTGESGNYAGQDCAYWQVAQLGSRVCVTEWGATLFSQTSMGPVQMTRTATEVRLGDGGPDEAFAYDEANATQAPNLQDVMQKMKAGN